MKKIILLCLLFLSSSVFAETSIVPPGVRAFVYHHINAEVAGHYGANGVDNSFDIREKLAVNLITQADPRTANVIKRLEETDPQLLNELDLGMLEVSPDIRVKVDVYGGAIGVSKDFMIVGVIPYYNASTHIAGGFTETQSLYAAAQKLRARANSDPTAPREQLFAFAQILEQLAAPNGNNLQGVLVNDLGYKPFGNWSGQGLGDVIFYGQYRPVNRAVYKQAFKLGVEVPTGRTDDPDNLVDVPFGKGHFVSFVEALNDFYVFDGNWVLAANAKYAYQWGHSPTYRLLPDSSIPLTSEKEQVYRKPGDLVTLNLHSEIKLISDLTFNTDYTYSMKYKDKVGGNRFDYDYGILERNTDQESHVGEIGFNFTTANLFMKKQFPVPFKIGTFMSRVLSGRNVDKINMATLRFEMYF